MTSERRQDVFLIALIFSVAAHIGLMFWASPRVMTEVPPSLRNHHRHGPVTVADAIDLPEPVKIDVFKDEAAKKSAPGVGGVAGEDAPSAGEQLPLPPAAEAIAIPDAPVVDAKLDPVAAPSLREPEALPRMELSTPVPIKSAAAERPAALTFAGSDWSLPPVGAAPSLPVLAPAATAEPLKLDEPDAGRPAFAATDKVQQDVDHRFVEREKEAVRRLINVADAEEIRDSVTVKLSAAEAGGWTYFRAEFFPTARLAAVPKDLVLLMDASGSIGRDRIKSCREAARGILRTCMNTGDRFNLVAFRDRFTYAFNAWQPCNAKSFEVADRWLSNLTAHGRTDVFATISSVLTLPRTPERPLIALVITDGDANEGVKNNAQILSKFAQLNDGLVSVFTYGVKASANRELLERLTAGNRGENFIYEGERETAGQGIEGLSERFRDPLLTDLRVVFAAEQPAEVHPKLLKNLYRGNSAAFVGRVRGQPAELKFSLRGLAGAKAYEGFFRLPLAGAENNPALVEEFAAAGRDD